MENKACLITGASRGLGAALARRLAARGARLALVARERAPLDQLVAEIRAAGGEAHALSFDVGDKAGVYPLAGAASALIGPIDVLVHNASTLGPTPLRLLLDTECEDFERVLEVNLVGPFRLSKVIAGSMALRGSGVMVHVSSDAAVAAYSALGSVLGLQGRIGSPGPDLGRGARRHRRPCLQRRSRRDGHRDAPRCDSRRRSEDPDRSRSRGRAPRAN